MRNRNPNQNNNDKKVRSRVSKREELSLFDGSVGNNTDRLLQIKLEGGEPTLKREREQEQPVVEHQFEVPAPVVRAAAPAKSKKKKANVSASAPAPVALPPAPQFMMLNNARSLVNDLEKHSSAKMLMELFAAAPRAMEIDPVNQPAEVVNVLVDPDIDIAVEAVVDEVIKEGMRLAEVEIKAQEHQILQEELLAQAEREHEKKLGQAYQAALTNIANLTSQEIEEVEREMAASRPNNSEFFKYNSQNALQYYAASGNLEKVNQILASKLIAVDDQGGCGLSPLWLAAYNGHVGVVKVLMDNRANPHLICTRQDLTYRTPFDVIDALIRCHLVTSEHCDIMNIFAYHQAPDNTVLKF